MIEKLYINSRNIKRCNHYVIRSRRSSMSKTVNQEKYFLHLLLESNKEQSRALLYTITPSQTLAISEIAYNLLRLDLPNKLKLVIEKRKRALHKIADKSKSVKIRTTLIKKHMTQLLNTLKLVKNQLKEVLL